VLRHTAIIVREFGPRAYLRCCLAMLMRRPATFLDLSCSPRAMRSYFAGARTRMKIRTSPLPTS
jgi:hypothetical protein